MTEFPGLDDIIPSCYAPSPLERLHQQHTHFREIITRQRRDSEIQRIHTYRHFDYLGRGLEDIFSFPSGTVEVFAFTEQNYFSVRFILDIFISPYIFPDNSRGLTRLRISSPRIDVGRASYIEWERAGYQLLESVIRHIKIKAEQDYRAQYDPLPYSVRLRYNATNLTWGSEIYPESSMLGLSAADVGATADYRVSVASNAQAEDQLLRDVCSQIFAGVRGARDGAVRNNRNAAPAANFDAEVNQLTYEANKKALAKARQHLLSRLTPEQLEEFKANETVTEIGASGTTYRLTRKRQINIQVLSPNGQVMYDLCAVSSEMNLPLDDQLAAQLLDIRTNEQGFLEVAIRHFN